MEPMAMSAIATTVAGLVKEYGPTAGRYLGDKINSNVNKQKAFLEGIVKNESVNSIVKRIFEDKFDSIMQEAKKTKKIRYESHSTEYISLPINKSSSKNEINDLLKAELSENLERLESETTDKVEFMNKASLIVTTWIKKFVELKNPEEQTIKKLKALHELLKPGKITAKDVFVMIKPLFGLGATLTLIYTAMLVLGAGMSVFYGLITALLGLPIIQVFSFATVGIILTYLALIPVNETQKVQIVINGLYGIIDDNIEDFAELIKREKESIQIQSKENELLSELENKLSQKKPNEDLAIIITLLKHVILVDGSEHSEEKNVLVNFLKDTYSLSEDEIMNSYTSVQSIENIDEFLKDLLIILDDSEKGKLKNIVKKIIVADGKIDEKEVAILKSLEKNLIKD